MRSDDLRFPGSIEIVVMVSRFCPVGRGQAMEGPGLETRPGVCCRAVGAGLAYPHTLSAVVRVVWGRSQFVSGT